MIGRNLPTWLKRLDRVRYAIVMLLSIVAVMSSAPASAQPPISITVCRKITQAGLYEVDNDLVASSPSAGDCLVITAPNVSLNLNRYRLIGATSAVGIHVMKSAAKAFIEGNGATIQTFGVGIQIDAAGALADNFIVLSNTDAGVLLNHVQQADLSNFSATNNLNDGVRINGGGYNVLQMPLISGNGRYGVWAQSSSHNSIGNFTVQNNAQAGVYIGCSTTGPQGVCPRGAFASNYNYMFSGIAGISSSGVQQYGVAIDHGNNFNRVVNVAALQNDQLDLFDANQDCASNYWFAEPTIGQVAPRDCIN
jgi:Periplasmic copper-binding protein (NosD)